MASVADAQERSAVYPLVLGDMLTRHQRRHNLLGLRHSTAPAGIRRCGSAVQQRPTWRRPELIRTSFVRVPSILAVLGQSLMAIRFCEEGRQASLREDGAQR